MTRGARVPGSPRQGFIQRGIDGNRQSILAFQGDGFKWSHLRTVGNVFVPIWWMALLASGSPATERSTQSLSFRPWYLGSGTLSAMLAQMTMAISKAHPTDRHTNRILRFHMDRSVEG